MIPYEEHIQGFNKWKENITTLPPERCIYHMYSFLQPDGKYYSNETPDFSKSILQLHHRVTFISLLNVKLLIRSLIAIVLLLPKDNGVPKINRMTIINTYEVE